MKSKTTGSSKRAGGKTKASATGNKRKAPSRKTNKHQIESYGGFPNMDMGHVRE
jgi:hypothetical protein